MQPALVGKSEQLSAASKLAQEMRKAASGRTRMPIWAIAANHVDHPSLVCRVVHEV